MRNTICKYREERSDSYVQSKLYLQVRNNKLRTFRPTCFPCNADNLQENSCDYSFYFTTQSLAESKYIITICFKWSLITWLFSKLTVQCNTGAVSAGEENEMRRLRTVNKWSCPCARQEGVWGSRDRNPRIFNHDIRTRWVACFTARPL
jgi:hypothetical protein